VEIFDISVGIDESLTIWPGDPELEIRWAAQIEKGDEVNLTKLSLGAHTGTHIDAPLHFISEGKSVDNLNWNDLIGDAQVISIPAEVNLITQEVLIGLPKITAPRVLFKTRNSQHWGDAQFQENYVALDASAAQWLVDNGTKLVGIDYLSIAPFDNPAPTHKILLSNDVIVLECLNLNRIEPGDYTLVCLPLKLAGREAAPARAILIKA